MKRRAFLVACAVGLALTRPAFAARDFVAEILRELGAQGYHEFEVSRTLLGRTRILAEGARGSREIIVNPVTGEILRDLRLGGGADDTLGSGDDGGTGGSGHGSGDDSGGDDSGGDDSGGDDDHGDDESGDGDNSGKGDGDGGEDGDHDGGDNSGHG